MDCIKFGALIKKLRTQQGLTQLQLAEKMNISDKAVSKWECGKGCPDVSLLGELSAILNVNLEELLQGELFENTQEGGNMKKTRFYVCETCGNVITSANEATLTCCGKKLKALTPVKAEDDEKLQVEIIENEYFISSEHEMTKEHYISFVALLTSDKMIMTKLYPEWNLQTRIPRIAHGQLIWYCTKHGLKYQLL